MSEWFTKAGDYIAALLDFEDVGNMLSCGLCNQPNQHLFRCSTCLGKSNYCQRCTVHLHRGLPFHRVARWDQQMGCFTSTSLGYLGAQLNLCKSFQYACPNPGLTSNLTVVHTNGFHDLPVQFCGCLHSPTPDLQLFGFRLFPATVNLPQTAFSFEVLEQFRYHHLVGKISAYTFMDALSRLTDDTGCMAVEVRFTIASHMILTLPYQDRTREFRRVSRQWNYLQILKLLGQYGDRSDSHSPLLAVFCPACPQPGKNIPSQWPERVPIEKQ